MATNTTETVRQLQRTLYAKAKQAKEAQFYSLYAKVWRTDVLWEAWQQVKANTGAPGVDGQASEAIVAGGQEREMLRKLPQQLRTQTYRFHPVRRVDIPKPKGGTRPLGIATVEDRVVQTAMKLVLEPIFEADCHPCSYGYRPKRDAKMASQAIKEDLYDHAWGVVEIDFQSYFTTIPHDKRLKLIKQRVVDGSLLRLIKQSLKVSVAYQGQVAPTVVGVPQGSPLSPLYSNISLNLLDQVWHKRGYPEKLGATLHRDADDAILVCRHSASQALQAFEAIATRMALTINRDKTRITKLTEGFDCLGFTFVKRRSPTSGKRASYIFPSKAAQRRVRQRIKAFTKRRAPIAPQEFVQQVNQVVRGWVHYYRHTNASQAFRALQRFINVRFRRYLTCRSKGRGFGWKQFPNRALYARGMISIGSRVIRYERAPVHAME
jgi:group II intron reverse transcriptase/maturase